MSVAMRALLATYALVVGCTRDVPPPQPETTKTVASSAPPSASSAAPLEDASAAAPPSGFTGKYDVDLLCIGGSHQSFTRVAGAVGKRYPHAPNKLTGEVVTAGYLTSTFAMDDARDPLCATSLEAEKCLTAAKLPERRTTLRLTLSIDGKGRVTKAEGTADLDPKLASCLTDATKKATFVPAKGNDREAEYELSIPPATPETKSSGMGGLALTDAPPTIVGALTPAAALATLRARHSRLQACYTQVLLTDARLAGDVTFVIDVGAAGKPTNIAASGAVKHPRAVDCMREVLQQASFPGATKVTYSVSLTRVK